MIDRIMSRIESGQFVLIAEIGVNYYDIAKVNGISPMDAAKLMIDEAVKAGIHAVKFQTYKAGTLAAKNSPSYWDTTEEATTSQYELFQKFDSFGEREYRELSEYCESKGIEFLSTAFDIESADYLYSMMNVYKISSSDLNNLPFVEYQAKKNKPIILSVGASNEEEIDSTIACIRKVNSKPIILMHCVLEYPTPYAHANLNKIVSLKKKYGDIVTIGYSDHTKPDEGYVVLQTAYNLGAQVIEKHYTLDKSLSGNDHYHAMDAVDAAKIINTIDYIEEIRGSYEIKCLDTEAAARQNARRSVVTTCSAEVGTVLSEEMLTFKRPGTGIAASELSNVIGRVLKTDVAEDTILEWSMLQ